jgi:hypothetical protein
VSRPHLIVGRVTAKCRSASQNAGSRELAEVLVVWAVIASYRRWVATSIAGRAWSVEENTVSALGAEKNEVPSSIAVSQAGHLVPTGQGGQAPNRKDLSERSSVPPERALIRGSHRPEGAMPRLK